MVVDPPESTTVKVPESSETEETINTTETRHVIDDSCDLELTPIDVSDAFSKGDLGGTQFQSCYTCHCKATFKHESWYLKHQLTHGPGTFECNKCSKVFKPVTIDRHRLYDSDDDVSNNSSDDESDESKYNYASSTSDDCTNSNSDEIPDDKYECADCHKLFKFKSWYNNHMTTHAIVGVHQCQYCPKKFKRRENLKRHFLVIYDMSCKFI
ncbi:putative zinc finger protein 840 [Metopolophium dirhodum]|uniref:putative zinc finger protein 840 n=1 Tax=Metopolophium dirhodum TaxID=44670 RepID=UPI00298FEFCB|nr:putative zinc finger protein 840 [Metopolophium dirhodum]